MSRKNIETLIHGLAVSKEIDSTIERVRMTLLEGFGMSDMVIKCGDKEYSVEKIIAASLAKQHGVADIKKISREFEKLVVNDALVKSRGNQTLAAKRIGCSRVKLRDVLLASSIKPEI